MGVQPIDMGCMLLTMLAFNEYKIWRSAPGRKKMEAATKSQVRYLEAQAASLEVIARALAQRGNSSTK